MPKHKGITWVICDMRSPGIEVRPIKMIDGDRDFAEVFYDEVRIPLTNVVGGIDNGWSVAMSTLSFERGTAFTLHQVQLAAAVESLIEVARSHRSINGRPVIDDDAIAQRLARARADVAALRALTYLGDLEERGARPSPDPRGRCSSFTTPTSANDVAQLAVDVLGAHSLALVDDDAGHRLDRPPPHRRSPTAIGGGTSEIQRNIIAERVLGLPR